MRKPSGLSTIRVAVRSPRKRDSQRHRRV